MKCNSNIILFQFNTQKKTEIVIFNLFLSFIQILDFRFLFEYNI